MRLIMLVLVAFAVASGTGFYVLRGLEEPSRPVETVQADAPRSVEVYVPATELAAGAIITPDKLVTMPIAEGSVTAEMVPAGDAGSLELIGSVARQVLPKGVPIARSAVVQPGERGFLAAVLPKGKRAISIPIGEVAGVSGLVLPGDRVDIILTYSVSGENIEAARDIRASETVMRNIRVLALDQRLTKEEVPEEEGQKALTPIARTATLEVTPQEAELVTLATDLGTLSMVLNSIRDGGEEVEVAGLQALGGWLGPTGSGWPAQPGGAPGANSRGARDDSGLRRHIAPAARLVGAQRPERRQRPAAGSRPGRERRPARRPHHPRPDRAWHEHGRREHRPRRLGGAGPGGRGRSGNTRGIEVPSERHRSA